VSDALKEVEYPIKDIKERRKKALFWVANDGFVYSKEMNRQGRPKGATG